ncbi:LysR family transcriptional regulator [Falsiroseomonas selenitidurans]|uniref:LysR family transcriptional regulator n=1 Tax=Falsiroseomonas selenitidurans TaxID=2716335 RepID=A0ABX1DY89_9PROT|nr:LysR family transcriptional regulator [Falsiroseomonas selenitidurans]NKC29869.1 LysR family transcriptional regulator [Falsiroseomonas selenitidurans]
MAVDFLGLEAFLSIAERGSFRKAAAHLNLSQTGLSHRIRKFEDALGCRLLARTTRQVTLTPAGLELAGRARGPVEALQAALAELRAGAGRREQSVTIGCLPTIAVHHVPRLLVEFAASYPGVTVKVFDNSASEIAERVARGEAEFGITIVSANRWDLDIVPLLTESFVVACPTGHDFAARAHLSWAELEGRPLVRVAPHTGNRALLDEALGARRDAMDWRYEVQHLATAISMVESGLALAVVPRLAVDAAGSPGVVAVPLRDPGVLRRLGVVSRRGVPLTPAAEALLALLRRHFRARPREKVLA